MMQQRRLLALLLALSAVGTVQGADTCFWTILDLAGSDKQLGANPAAPEKSRLEQKGSLGLAAGGADDFASQLAAQRSAGTNFSAANGADWVSEVFVGLAGQWPEFNSSEAHSGYEALSAAELSALFTANAASEGHFLYQLSHGGYRDHTWVVEQLPDKEGYRIYQSYGNVYSMKAWLSPNGTDLEKLWEEGEISANAWLTEHMDAVIREGTSGGCSIETVHTCAVGTVPQEGIEYIVRARDEQRGQVLEAFAWSWAKWGQGQVVPADAFLSEYLPRLASLAAFIEENQRTGVATPQSYVVDWAYLYAAFDRLSFLGLPFNSADPLLDSTEPYALYARVSQLGGTEEQNSACDSNAGVLRASLVPATEA